ncbi:C-C chemokine receptor type 2-like isoform X1 [Labeo rohita]|uniref:C-C chemokine receptor type 2-like isoform X1 n=1 Tax=Labeo rohita TaxID=84645 RepID=UPI0021E1D688|nr:C-C chemokine receptor type 2-like isoform X1 [Labeo rohita]
MTEEPGTEADTTLDYSDYYDHVKNYESPCNGSNTKPFIRVFFPILYSTAFIVGLIGNALVLWVLIRNRQRSSLTDVCFLNLALCDLLFVVSLPFWAHSAAQEWVFGTFACHAVSGLVMMGLYGSVFFMVLMTLDRYVIVVYKCSICSRKWPAKMALALFVWMLSLFVSLPNIVFAKVKQETCIKTSCGPEFPKGTAWMSVTYLNVLSLILPLIIVSFCFCRIISIKSEEKHGVIRLLVAVLAVYFLFWTPYNVVMFFKFLQTKGFTLSSEADLAMPFVEAIALSHCCLNPIIYTCVGQKFRRAVLTGPKEQFPSTCSPQSPDYSFTLIA